MAVRGLPFQFAANPPFFRAGSAEDLGEELTEEPSAWTRYVLRRFTMCYYRTEAGMVPYSHLDPSELSVRVWAAFNVIRVSLNHHFAVQRQERQHLNGEG